MNSLEPTCSASANPEQVFQRGQQIVEAAYELIEESGLNGLTIRAVLKKTGLSRRAFYERFEGKDDLMLAVFKVTIERAAILYAAQVKSLPDPIERLKLIVMSMGLGTSDLEHVDTLPQSRRASAMSREHIRLSESRPIDLQAALSPLIMLIAGELSDGMKAGAVRQSEPSILAMLVYNLVSTTVQTEFLLRENTRPDREYRTRLASDIWTFCKRAVAA